VERHVRFEKLGVVVQSTQNNDAQCFLCNAVHLNGSRASHGVTWTAIHSQIASQGQTCQVVTACLA
jgi:hypothetical protein